MSKMEINDGVMKIYNDDGNLIYEGGYSEFAGDVEYPGFAVCKSGHGKEYENGNLIYIGEWKNGKRNGYGVALRNYSKNGIDYRKYYQGDWKDGKEDGFGIAYTTGRNSQENPDGTNVRKFYEGDFVEGRWNGKGKIYGNYNTLVYEGDIKYEEYKKHGVFGMCNGYGKRYYLDTETLQYEGEFRHGKFDGMGKLYTHPKAVLNDKGVYVGTGEKGTLKYEGMFSEGVYDGYGKEYFPHPYEDMVSVEGDWEMGELLAGKQYNPTYPIVYEGEFEGDFVREGKGKLRDDGILYYDGDFKNHMPWGKGKLYDKGVIAYDGDFVEGRREGHGKYYIDGTLVYDGEWKDGVPTKPWEGYDKGKEDYRYDEGNLCGRFRGMATVLLENRRGTIC